MAEPRVSARGSGRRNIMRRVALLVGAGASAAMAIFAWAAWSSVDDFKGQLRLERQTLAASLALAVDRQVQENLTLLSAVSSAPHFDVDDDDPSAERAALHAARLRSRHLASVSLLLADGRSAVEEPTRGSAAEAVRGVPELSEALRSGRPMVSSLVPGPPARIFLLAPFRDRGGRIVGVVAGAVDPAAAWPLAIGPSGSDGSTDLVDTHETILASTEVRRSLRRFGAAGDFLVASPLSSAPWRVVVRQPEPQALAVVRRLRTRLLLLGPVLLALALLFAWGASRSLIRPLALLNSAAERIAGGDIAHPVPPVGDDEVGVLGRSLETMRAALQQSLAALGQERQDLAYRVAERTRELEALYAKLSEKDERRGQLLQKAISAQEDERKRIARELHDQTCQALAALILLFETTLANRAPEPVRERLVEAKAMAKQTLEEVYQLILDLRPAMLDDLGLPSAIRWYAARLLQPLGIAVRCELEGLEARLPPEIETALFRAVQEALSNVARHAAAESVLIQSARQDGVLEIEIEDDGKGFDAARVSEPGACGRGLGLMGMRERLELLGGSAQIDSAPGNGTRVELRLPLEG